MTILTHSFKILQLTDLNDINQLTTPNEMTHTTTVKQFAGSTEY